MALQLYLNFLCIFIIIGFVFLFIEFAIKFFKLNGIKFFLVILNKENRLLLVLNLVFIVIFWLAFYNIFYLKVFPQLRVWESVENQVYSNGCKIGYDCKKINKININYRKDITLEITEYRKDYIKFKLNKTVYGNTCEKCKLTTIKANKEYKMSVNEAIDFNIMNDNNLKYHYTIALDK